MEIRASYLLVGSVVLVLVAALAGFGVWLVKADVDQQRDFYEIAFAGPVTGLQRGGGVYYRGVPVGRVDNIRIDPDNVEQILVTIDVEAGTPIKKDTVAMLESQGLTGIAYVQLRGGTQKSPLLLTEEDEEEEPPRIESRRSALDRVFESTPDLLASSVTLIERLSRLFEEGNVESVAKTLENVEVLTGALADESGQMAALIGDAKAVASDVKDVSAELSALTADLRGLTASVDDKVEGVSGDLVATLAELRTAASALGGAAGQLDGMIGDLREPMDDFAGSGLYEFTQLVGETRRLIAALTRITTEFERDPAGFLIGGQKGFEPE